jgi:hypothetical protein
MSAPLLEIRIGFVDGSEAVYTQDDPDTAKRMLSRLQPERVFTQATLVVGGEHHVSVFPVAQIAHVEVRSDELPEWPFGTNFERIVGLDEDTFDRRLAELASVSRKELRFDAGQDVVGYARLEVRGGFVHRLGLHAKALPSAVRGGRLTRLFDAPVLYVRRGENTALLINIRNSVGLRVYPGMPELPPHAIEAHETAREES